MPIPHHQKRLERDPEHVAPVLEGQEAPAGGHELDERLREELRTGGAVTEVRAQLGRVVGQVERGSDSHRRGEQYLRLFDEATQGHATGQLRVLSGEDGHTHVGSADAEYDPKIFDPRSLEERPKHAQEVVEHEAGGKGHATQIPGVRPFVWKGRVVTPWQSYEGSVEVQQSKKFRGGAAAPREGQPEDYAEAQQTAAGIGDVLEEYVRKDGKFAGNREAFQGELWRRKNVPREQRIREGAAIGMSEEEVVKAQFEEEREKPLREAA